MTKITKQKIIESSVVGAITGLVSLPFEHPFDALKTNMQSKQLRFFKAYHHMKSTKGWRSFYNGFSMNCIRVVLKQGFRWPLWISWAGVFTQYFSHYNIVFKESLTGFAISFTELILLCPFQRLKTWLMTTKTQEQTSLKNYFRLHTHFTELYAGFTPMLLRQDLSWSSFLTASSFFKEKWRIINNYEENYELNFYDLMLISIPVAIVNTLFIMPVDCIKTFYQEYETVFMRQPLKEMMKKHGIKNIGGLYIGWEARMIQYMIQSTFTLTSFEAVSHQYLLQKRRKNREKFE